MDKIYYECCQMFDNVKLRGDTVYVRIDYFPVYRRFIIKYSKYGGYKILLQTCLPPLWITYGLNKGYPIKVGRIEREYEAAAFINRRLIEMQKK